jgi:hypothetical protein
MSAIHCSNLTNWKTALEKLDLYLEGTPELPKYIPKLLNNSCPVYPHRQVNDSHCLYLIPPGTLNEHLNRIKRYAESVFKSEKHALKLSHFWKEAQKKYGDVSCTEYEGVLLMKNVLPESRSQLYEGQVHLVRNLSHGRLGEYQVPTLRQMVITTLFHELVTGERLFESGNEKNGYCATYGRLQEEIEGFRLVFGGMHENGGKVEGYRDYMSDLIGVSAVKVFSVKSEVMK